MARTKIILTLFIIHFYFMAVYSQHSIKIQNISTNRIKIIRFKEDKYFSIGAINRNKSSIVNAENIYRISEIYTNYIEVQNDSLLIYASQNEIKETFHRFTVTHHYAFKALEPILIPLDQIDYLKMKRDRYSNFYLASRGLIGLGVLGFILSPAFLSQNVEKNYKTVWLTNISLIGLGVTINLLQPKDKYYYFNRKFIRKNNNWTFIPSS